MTNIELIDALSERGTLELNEWTQLLSEPAEQEREYAADRARAIAQREFGRNIYIRGIIEFTSYCRNDCLYCGLRRSNARAQRYRLDAEEIMECCAEGYEAGFRTFVLQGGEDAYFDDDLSLIHI